MEKHQRHTEETKARISEALKGRTFSKQSRLKMSAAQTGKKRKPVSQETRDKISAALMGKKVSLETRNKMSRKRTGMRYKVKRGRPPLDPAQRKPRKYILDAEERAILGDDRPHMEETPFTVFPKRTRKPMSQETKDKIAAAHLGKKKGSPSQETRDKIAASNRARITPETREASRNRTLGRTHSDEARRKISEAHLGRQHTAETKKLISLKLRLAHRARIAACPLNGLDKLPLPLHKRLGRTAPVSRFSAFKTTSYGAPYGHAADPRYLRIVHMTPAQHDYYTSTFAEYPHRHWGDAWPHDKPEMVVWSFPTANLATCHGWRVLHTLAGSPQASSGVATLAGRPVHLESTVVTLRADGRTDHVCHVMEPAPW